MGKLAQMYGSAPAPMRGGNPLTNTLGVMTNTNVGGATFKNPANSARVKAAEAAASAGAKKAVEMRYQEKDTQAAVDRAVRTQQAKSQQLINENFRRIHNNFSAFMSSWRKIKKVDATAPAKFLSEFGGPGQVLAGKLQKHITGPSELNPSVEAFDGHRRSLATELMRMAMPGARAVKGVESLFLKTLPRIDNGEQAFADQLSNSLHNAAATSAAINNVPYDPYAVQNKIDMQLRQVMTPKEYNRFRIRTKDNLVVGNPATIPSMLHDNGYNYDGTRPDDINEETGQPEGVKTLDLSNFEVIQKGKPAAAIDPTDAEIKKLEAELGL